MTRKTAQFLPASDNDIEDVYTTRIMDETDEEMTAAEALAQSAVEQLNNTAEKGKTVKIYRQTGSGKESMQFIMSEPADKYSIDELILKVKDEYGGGDYRFMIYNEKGRLAANKLICIASKLDKSQAENNGIFGVFSQYMNKQDRLIEELINKKSGDNSRADFLQEMLIMKQLFANDNVNNNTNMVSQMKEMMQAMQMMKEMSGEEKESESGFGSFMRESIPLLTEVARAAGKTRQQNPQQRPEQSNQNTGMNQMINVAASQILSGIKAGKSADDLAHHISGQVPDAYTDNLLAFINDSKCVINLINAQSELKNHVPYIRDVQEWIKWIFGEPNKFDSDELTPDKADDTIADNEKPSHVQAGDSTGG